MYLDMVSPPDINMYEVCMTGRRNDSGGRKLDTQLACWALALSFGSAV